VNGSLVNVVTQTFIFLTYYPWSIVLTGRVLFNDRKGEQVPAVR
jgi:hypothetical protein